MIDTKAAGRLIMSLAKGYYRVWAKGVQEAGRTPTSWADMSKPQRALFVDRATSAVAAMMAAGVAPLRIDTWLALVEVAPGRACLPCDVEMVVGAGETREDAGMDLFERVVAMSWAEEVAETDGPAG